MVIAVLLSMIRCRTHISLTRILAVLAVFVAPVLVLSRCFQLLSLLSFDTTRLIMALFFHRPCLKPLSEVYCRGMILL